MQRKGAATGDALHRERPELRVTEVSSTRKMWMARILSYPRTQGGKKKDYHLKLLSFTRRTERSSLTKLIPHIHIQKGERRGRRNSINKNHKILEKNVLNQL